jgi:ferritin-like metal-binding protein YciE
MSEKNLEALFLHSLKELYFAEQQALKGLPAMAKAAETEELCSALEEHRGETEDQIRRLERIFESMDQRVEAVPADGILGVIKEGQAVLERFAGGEAFEAGLIAAAQAIEHYEIARYGTLVAWAEQLGLSEAADLLEESLEEETDTDEILSEIAEAAINREAV